MHFVGVVLYNYQLRDDVNNTIYIYISSLLSYCGDYVSLR